MSKARELADLGSVTTRLDEVGNTDGALSNRNLIINGAMQVAQRGTSAAVGGNTYLCDRFFCTNTGTSTLTYSQETDAPNGFSSSSKVTVGTAQSLQATDYTQFTTHLEGYNIAHLGYGTAAAQDIVLSFWVKSSLTGTFGVTVANSAVDQNYIASYSISSANTWEKKTITISGATAGTWNADNTRALSLYWDMGIGSTFSSSTKDTWLSSFVFGLTGAVKLKETAGATWQITGVQLELGDTATPFEHRSYSDELQRCMRYYEKLDDPMFRGVEISGLTARRMGCHFLSKKRATPTVSLDGTLLVYNGIGTGTITQSNLQSTWANNSSFNFDSNISSSGTSAGQACVSYTQTSGTVGCSLLIDAEL